MPDTCGGRALARLGHAQHSTEQHSTAHPSTHPQRDGAAGQVCTSRQPLGRCKLPNAGGAMAGRGQAQCGAIVARRGRQVTCSRTDGSLRTRMPG